MSILPSRLRYQDLEDFKDFKDFKDFEDFKDPARSAEYPDRVLDERTGSMKSLKSLKSSKSSKSLGPDTARGADWRSPQQWRAAPGAQPPRTNQTSWLPCVSEQLCWLLQNLDPRPCPDGQDSHG